VRQENLFLICLIYWVQTLAINWPQSPEEYQALSTYLVYNKEAAQSYNASFGGFPKLSSIQELRQDTFNEHLNVFLKRNRNLAW